MNRRLILIRMIYRALFAAGIVALLWVGGPARIRENVSVLFDVETESPAGTRERDFSLDFANVIIASKWRSRGTARYCGKKDFRSRSGRS